MKVNLYKSPSPEKGEKRGQDHKSGFILLKTNNF